MKVRHSKDRNETLEGQAWLWLKILRLYPMVVQIGVEVVWTASKQQKSLVNQPETGFLNIAVRNKNLGVMTKW